MNAELENQLCADDSLVVFYAGHGGVRTQRVGSHEVRTGYLIPVDGTSGSGGPATWVELDPWIHKIARLPAKHILVLLDACFSGTTLTNTVKWGRGDGLLPDIHFIGANSRTSRPLITSALTDESARDGGPMPGHSLFTGCVLEALNGGAACVAHRDGKYLTIGSEVGRYVRNRVQTYPGLLGSRQTPDFGTFAYDDRGEMLIPILDVRDAGESEGDCLDTGASLAHSRADCLRSSNAIRLLESGERDTSVREPGDGIARQPSSLGWWARAKAGAIALGRRMLCGQTCTHDVDVYLSGLRVGGMPDAPATEPIVDAAEEVITSVPAVQQPTGERELELAAATVSMRRVIEHDGEFDLSASNTEPMLLLSEIDC